MKYCAEDMTGLASGRCLEELTGPNLVDVKNVRFHTLKWHRPTYDAPCL